MGCHDLTLLDDSIAGHARHGRGTPKWPTPRSEAGCPAGAGLLTPPTARPQIRWTAKPEINISESNSERPETSREPSPRTTPIPGGGMTLPGGNLLGSLPIVDSTPGCRMSQSRVVSATSENHPCKYAHYNCVPDHYRPRIFRSDVRAKLADQANYYTSTGARGRPRLDSKGGAARPFRRSGAAAARGEELWRRSLDTLATVVASQMRECSGRDGAVVWGLCLRGGQDRRNVFGLRLDPRASR